ncbi:hypothetical protein KKF91_19225 [Myxococcota bacterium]|nr:hypothetical protein [Myxococcota bacterium]MBU1432678.1 hypothetical protein [Myxococcota bacterium]MBU1898303.1 hypothetical protein [Myxococcota bacterium]
MEIYLFLPKRRRLGALGAALRRHQLQLIEGRLPVRGHFSGREGLLILLIDPSPGEAGQLTPRLTGFIEAAMSAHDALDLIWGEVVEDEEDRPLSALGAPLRRGCCYTLHG